MRMDSDAEFLARLAKENASDAARELSKLRWSRTTLEERRTFMAWVAKFPRKKKRERRRKETDSP